jgi:hypothetical protein
VLPFVPPGHAIPQAVLLDRPAHAAGEIPLLDQFPGRSQAGGLLMRKKIREFESVHLVWFSKYVKIAP